LNDTGFPIWDLLLDTKKIKFPLEYKYLIVDTATDEVLAWGGGPNRKLEYADNHVLTVVTDEHFLRTIPSWKGSGVAIPVFRCEAKKGLELANSTI